MTSVDLRHGDSLAVLPTLDTASVDAVVTDPPYGLEFMGRAWDDAVPGVDVWAECLRVLKPGGHLLAFGGTRTVHRLACAIEDAGFEIRDQISWLYGSGFPKGKGQLKPAHEPIIVGRRQAPAPRLNVDACRTPAGPGGRWPANVVLVHGEACTEDGCQLGCPVAELDAQSGPLPTQDHTKLMKPQVGTKGEHNWGSGNPSRYPDERGTGASRYFPSFRYQAKAPTRERPKIDGKGWPTVKPLSLMRWLVRLVTPPGGLVLDPFAGTGATLQAAELEGFRALGIERDPFAYQLACQRLGSPGSALTLDLPA